MRSISRSLAIAVVAALVVVLVPAGASAAVTQTSSCTDGGKHPWQAHSVWGAEYRDAAGVNRITNDTTGFTSAAPDATTVDYSVKGYDGNGQLIYSATEENRVFNFQVGTAYLNLNPRNPPSAPGKA